MVNFSSNPLQKSLSVFAFPAWHNIITKKMIRLSERLVLISENKEGQKKEDELKKR
jgi:hypothetical protein